MSLEAIGVLVFTVLFSIIGWLGSRQIASSQAQIKDLYRKHEIDADKLVSLELKLSDEYHKRHVVDSLFSTMRQTMKDGFDDIKEAIRELKGDYKHQNGNNHNGHSQ